MVRALFCGRKALGQRLSDSWRRGGLSTRTAPPPRSDLEGLGWGLEPAFLVSPQGRAGVLENFPPSPPALSARFQQVCNEHP